MKTFIFLPQYLNHDFYKINKTYKIFLSVHVYPANFVNLVKIPVQDFNKLKITTMRSKKQTENAPTCKSIWSDLKETGKLLKEIAKQSKEDRKVFQETDRRLKETEKLVDKNSRSLEKMYEESRREMKELNKQLGGISNSNGEMAETYFYNAFKANKRFANEQYDHIQQPTRVTNGEVEAEFDIILFNGKSVAIIEVKYNAKPDNISVRRLIDRVEVFKILYPNYKNHNIYLGVAAMTFRKGLEERLHRNGIATIRQVGKKMVVYDKEVRVF